MHSEPPTLLSLTPGGPSGFSLESLKLCLVALSMGLDCFLRVVGRGWYLSLIVCSYEYSCLWESGHVYLSLKTGCLSLENVFGRLCPHLYQSMCPQGRREYV